MTTDRVRAIRADINAAIAARLSSIDAETAQIAASAVYGLSAGPCDVANDKDRMAAILAGLGINSARNASAVFHALLAKGAEAAGDLHAYASAVLVLMESQRQAQRAAGKSRGDVLDSIIREAVIDLPDFTPAMLWAEFARRALVGGDSALADYDPVADVISFEPRHGADLADIGFPAFRRRVQRARKMRQQPADVAPARHHRINQHPPRLAA